MYIERTASTNSENVILTVTMGMMSTTFKAALINLWTLEGRRSPKQADKNTNLKYHLIKFTSFFLNSGLVSTKPANYPLCLLFLAAWEIW